jgi:hypothetical protein
VRLVQITLGLAVVLCLVVAPSEASSASSVSSQRGSIISFLTLADRALSGTFSEVYRISTGRVQTGGVVAVAQKAAAGQEPFVTGRGTWSFVYQNQAGYSSQWIEGGPTTWDCWRPPGAPEWTCSGPGIFDYVNGYLMAIEPYVPGQLIGEENELKGALHYQARPFKKTAQKIIAAITFSRTRSPHFGSLRCMEAAGYTTCLDSAGVMVSQRSGPEVITLLHYSSNAPPAAFKLEGAVASGPFVALHQPYVPA